MDNIQSIHLRYFPFPGRAASIRDTLNIGKVTFEDDFIPPNEFGKRRKTGEFPFGGLPVLDVITTSGKITSAQSNAILRFAGRLANLYPVDDILLALKVDEALDLGEDINQLLDPSLHEQDDQKKMAMRKVLAEQTLPEWATYLEHLLINNGSTGFIVGKTLTVADLKLYWIFEWFTSGMLDGIPTDMFDSYTLISGWRKNIAQIRQLSLENSDN